MTKLELEQRVAELEEQLKGMPDAEALKKKEEQLIKETFEHRKRADLLAKTVEAGKAEHEKLTSKFNQLATLFDAHIKASDDIVETNKLFLRNILRTQELMKIKITAFNGKGDEKE
jgi:hypothetical protein